jgi:hypothetical protein
MNFLLSLARIPLGAAVVALVSSCATTPQAPAVREDLLSQAGFKTIVASTPQQQQHLLVLHQGTVSQMQQTGRHYYVYPDTANKRLYVGTPKEYQAYLALRTRNGLPNPEPPNVTTADIQNYLKQDAAMNAADAQAATIPSYAIWPDFGGLGWIP